MRFKKYESLIDTQEELSVFLNLCKEQLPAMWYTLLHTLAYTGMRREEILALTWKDIDFKTGRIRINKTLTLDENNKIIVNDTKTTAGERNIKIDTQTIQLLKAWKKWIFIITSQKHSKKMQ